jgi:hypothetical protein
MKANSASMPVELEPIIKETFSMESEPRILALGEETIRPVSVYSSARLTR